MLISTLGRAFRRRYRTSLLDSRRVRMVIDGWSILLSAAGPESVVLVSGRWLVDLMCPLIPSLRAVSLVVVGTSDEMELFVVPFPSLCTKESGVRLRPVSWRSSCSLP